MFGWAWLIFLKMSVFEMKIGIECDWCGTTIYKWESQIKNAQNHFCNLNHYYKWRVGKPTQPCSEETKEKIRVSNTGKIQSKETCEKRSKSVTGEKNHFYNKKHKQESKDKIGNGNRGKKRTIEQRENISNCQKGRKAWNKGLSKETDERVKKMYE